MTDEKIKPEEARSCALACACLAFVAAAALACGFAFGAELGFLVCALAALPLLVRARRVDEGAEREEGRDG